MATNFEYYKDKVLEISKGAFSVALKNGKVYSCQKVHCNECDFHKHNPCVTCNAPRFEWLYAEHIKLPKLTKRERAFCEAVQTGWIARECNMHLFYFSGKPELKQGAWMTRVGQHCRIKGIEDAFMFIKDTDSEPWSIEDLLKLDVIEEVQHETD